MKAIILIAAVAATVTLMSCSKTENGELDTLKLNESKLLSIATNFGNVATRATISEFPDQSAIGLFATNGSLGTNYNNVGNNSNVKSIYDGGIWKQSPSIYLSPANATVFAYYPYASSNNNGTIIPVEHNSQTDYLYGTHSTGQPAVNSGNPSVNLTMKHVLSLLQFQISKNNYTGQGTLTKIEIGNKTGKTVLYSEGTINISNGIIANTTNKNQSAIINTSYTLPVTTSVLVLPVTTTIAAGDIQINFTIDGKIYTYPIPANTKWEQGKINTYTITLSGKDLIVNSVSITDWVNGTNGSVTLQ